jgi:hypothetical protein
MLRSVESANRQNQQKSGTLPAASSLPGRHAALPESKFVRLQAMHGNQGVQRLLRGGVLQRKLTINEPGDAFEQEADRVAEKVMRMPDPAAAREPVATSGMGARLQRCSCGTTSPGGGQCEECKSKAMQLQRSSATSVGAATAPPIVHDVLNSPGKPLDAATRNFMEPRFGADFNNVRVHTGDKAAESAQVVDALAYTVGNHMVFGRGQDETMTTSGKRLVAHELTHVLQQRSIASGTTASIVPPSLQRTCGPDIGTRTGCDPATGDPPGDRALFKVNCDEYLTPADENQVKDFADSMSASDRVRIHGFASTDGNAVFNENLSCARAEAAQNTLAANSIDRGKTDLLKHGPTPGPAAQRRSVILERVPGASRPVVPQLTPVIDIGPTPGACGDNNFVIHWEISRNSDVTNGGFIIQDITVTWSEFDCAGNPNNVQFSGLPSPVHYFEAWRVNPGSKTIPAIDGNTDTFNVTNNPGCTSGQVTFQAVAAFHDNVATVPSPPMSRFNPNTLANNLQSSVTDPHVGGNISRPVVHNLTWHWNCCPCQSAPSVVDTHTP